MTEETVSYSYEQTSSAHLKNALARLGPLPGRNDVQGFTEFRILDGASTKILFTQRYHDSHADKKPEGTSQFGPYFRRGVIVPDGDILVSCEVLPWRMAVMEYHAGWYITVLNGAAGRPSDFPVNPMCWGGTLAGIPDDQIRTEAVSRSVAGGPDNGRTYQDMLLFVHNVHRNHTYGRTNYSTGESRVEFSV